MCCIHVNSLPDKLSNEQCALRNEPMSNEPWAVSQNWVPHYAEPAGPGGVAEKRDGVDELDV